MPHPFSQAPTLREFIDAAVRMGCEERSLEASLVGSRGAMTIRYLLSPAKKVIYPLPDIADHERLAHSTVASLERALGIDTGLVPDLDPGYR